MTGGSPWGAILGTDGAIYVTQGGNVPGSGDLSAVPGVQRVRADGTVELLTSSIDGHALASPNDLAFGPDGRLWFTDSGTEGDDRYPVREPGRLYALDACGGGELVLERPEVYPNGIAFDAQGRLYWTESLAHRVCRLEDGVATTFASSATTTCPTAWHSPPTAGCWCARPSRSASPCSHPEGEILRRSRSASTRRTAFSTALPCT